MTDSALYTAIILINLSFFEIIIDLIKLIQLLSKDNNLLIMMIEWESNCTSIIAIAAILHHQPVVHSKIWPHIAQLCVFEKQA